MSYQQHEIESQRADILRCLSESSTGEMHEQMLQRLLEQLAHYLTQGELRAQTNWLTARDLITTRQVIDVQVYTLTQTGRLIALGKRKHAGIAPLIAGA